MLAALAAAALPLGVAAPPRGGVNITWGEFTDRHCRQPLGTPAPALQALGACGVVPATDPNAQWRRSSFRFDRCTTAGEPAVALYRAFSDGACARPFVNWTLSRAAMDCVRVPPGPNRGAPAGAPIWHSVLDISCVELPPAPLKSDDPCAKPAPGGGGGSCSKAAPPGFRAKGNGWFAMSPAENKSHPSGDGRPTHAANGRNNISIECCSYFCLADPQCKGFHVYHPCTCEAQQICRSRWRSAVRPTSTMQRSCVRTGDGGHPNCYIAYTDTFLPHTADDPSPAFLRDASSPAPPAPPNWEATCTAPLPVPNSTCLGGHTLKLDSEGLLETWLPQATAYHDLVTQAMAFLDHVGDDPANGLPVLISTELNSREI